MKWGGGAGPFHPATVPTTGRPSWPSGFSYSGKECSSADYLGDTKKTKIYIGVRFYDRMRRAGAPQFPFLSVNPAANAGDANEFLRRHRRPGRRETISNSHFHGINSAPATSIGMRVYGRGHRVSSMRQPKPCARFYNCALILLRRRHAENGPRRITRCQWRSYGLQILATEAASRYSI
jgi:hypothetical protein